MGRHLAGNVVGRDSGLYQLIRRAFGYDDQADPEAHRGQG